MPSLAFRDRRLETLFALQFAAQGRTPAACALGLTTFLSLLGFIRCVSLAAAAGLTPRLALLTVLAATALCAHAWTLITVCRPSQVWKHESVKSSNSLVGATVCMMGGILSHQPELGLKSPVGITCFRGCMLPVESYRLNIALRLHAIQMVCFVFQEIDLYLQSSGSTPRSPWAALKDLAIALLLGKALPILATTIIEARSRAAFLRARRLPLSHLSPFWRGCVSRMPRRLRP